MSQLREALDAAVRGDTADTELDVLGPPGGPVAAAVLAFTGRCVVASAAPEAWVRESLRSESAFAAIKPTFRVALAAKLALSDNGEDVVLAAPGLPGAANLSPSEQTAHPRVVRAHVHRADVQVYEAADGEAVVIIGRGLEHRLEVSVEVPQDQRGRGYARRALLEARRLISPGEWLFAQCAPGNAASLRALLAAGFRPIGSEALFFAK